MVEIKINNNVVESSAEGSILTLTAELMSGTVSVLGKMLEGTNNTIKTMHINMYCDVLRDELKERLL